jgi:hypothetical protein
MKSISFAIGFEKNLSIYECRGSEVIRGFSYSPMVPDPGFFSKNQANYLSNHLLAKSVFESIYIFFKC